MQVTVQGKQIDLGKALRTHVTDKMEDINAKFFNHATFATVTFSREGHGHGLVKTHISISVGKNIMVMADAAEGDAYLSFDVASAKVAKQLRRYKKRLRDHHDRLEKVAVAESIQARYSTLDSYSEPNPDEDMLKGKDPVVVAEIVTDIQTLSVADAVMRLDLAHLPALLFRNPSNGSLNMIYRRADGNIGWVDPVGNAVRRPAKKAEPKAAPKAVKKPVGKQPVRKVEKITKKVGKARRA